MKFLNKAYVHQRVPSTKIKQGYKKKKKKGYSDHERLKGLAMV